eukprot:Colp12_sorted_trinity150504_noHs@14836
MEPTLHSLNMNHRYRSMPNLPDAVQEEDVPFISRSVFHGSMLQLPTDSNDMQQFYAIYNDLRGGRDGEADFNADSPLSSLDDGANYGKRESDVQSDFGSDMNFYTGDNQTNADRETERDLEVAAFYGITLDNLLEYSVKELNRALIEKDVPKEICQRLKACRRRVKNRRAAQICREKRQSYYEDLEKTMQTLKTRNDQLLQELTILKRENEELRQTLRLRANTEPQTRASVHDFVYTQPLSGGDFQDSFQESKWPRVC